MMNCMESFNIRINQASLADNSNGAVQTWGTAGEYFFTLFHLPTNNTSLYNLQGFKRPNIYGVKVTGIVQSYFALTTKNAVIQDWSFILKLNGTSALTSGNISGLNGFAIQTTSPDLNTFSLSKYTNSIEFANPYTNVESIEFRGLTAQGIGAQALNEIYLIYDLLFTFYYQYEGE
jgi:hypothetical protein